MWLRSRRVAAFLVVLFIPLCASAAGKIVVGSGISPPLVATDYSPGFIESLVTEAFARLGIEFEVINLPAERALVNANRGIEDGNLLRIAGLEKYYPNLMRVPEKLMDTEFVGYSMKDIPAGEGWQRLQCCTAAYVTGWKIFENNTRSAAAVSVVGEPTQLFRLIKEGRVDVGLYEKWQGILLARKVGLKNYHVLEPPFTTKEQFMYLHKKHAALVPEVARVLREMKQDGTYQKIFDQTLGILQP